MSKVEELTTSDLAKKLGIAPDLIRKWKARGFLKLAPQGVSGQGRGHQMMWSEDAQSEVAKVMHERKVYPNHNRVLSEPSP